MCGFEALGLNKCWVEIRSFCLKSNETIVISAHFSVAFSLSLETEALTYFAMIHRVYVA